MRRGELLLRFGAQVRQNRLRLGMSQEALADAAGLDRTYISGLERGTRNVSLVNLVALAAGLGMTVSGLLAGLEGHGVVATDERPC